MAKKLGAERGSKSGSGTARGESNRKAIEKGKEHEQSMSDQVLKQAFPSEEDGTTKQSRAQRPKKQRAQGQR